MDRNPVRIARSHPWSRAGARSEFKFSRCSQTSSRLCDNECSNFPQLRRVISGEDRLDPHPTAENFHARHPLSSFDLVAPASGHSAHDVGDASGIVTGLRAGGYVILVRYGATCSDQADTEPFNLADASKQRTLNDDGKGLAKAFSAIRATSVVIGQVCTSKFNGLYEIALLAGFTNIEKTIDLSEGGLVVTPDENRRRAKALRTMLAKPPGDGKSITHKPNIIDALGKEWFDLKEGETSIFKPEGGSDRLFARVQMEYWPRLTSAGMWRSRNKSAYRKQGVPASPVGFLSNRVAALRAEGPARSLWAKIELGVADWRSLA